MSRGSGDFCDIMDDLRLDRDGEAALVSTGP